MGSLACLSLCKGLSYSCPEFLGRRPDLLMQLGSKEAQLVLAPIKNPGACSSQLMEVAQSSPFQTSTAFTLQKLIPRVKVLIFR